MGNLITYIINEGGESFCQRVFDKNVPQTENFTFYEFNINKEYLIFKYSRTLTIIFAPWKYTAFLNKNQ